MRPEHIATNDLIESYLAGGRAGWARKRRALPSSIRAITLDLEKRQRLNIENNDHRYLPWCTVRPTKGNQDET